MAGIRAIAALSVTFALAGCGDGTSFVVSAPAPTYTKLADLTGNQTFQSAGVRVDSNSQGTAAPLGQGMVLQFSASNNSYTVSTPDGAAETFGPSDTEIFVPPLPANVRVFAKSAGLVTTRLTLEVPKVNGVLLSYTQFSTLSVTASNTWFGVSGEPTFSSDMPRSGTASYDVAVDGTVGGTAGARPLGTYSTGTFTADFGAGTVATSLHLQSGTQFIPPTDYGTFTGTGHISGSAFTGTLAGTTPGGFSGAFFGPQAKEMGYAWYLSDGPLNPILAASGTVAGVKH